MEMSECIKPDDICQGDWVTYLHGEASETVNEHIKQCAFCAGQVESLRMLDARLLNAFYRDACPTPEVLADYSLGRLTDVERLRVAAHVRSCPACSEELASVESWQTSEPPNLLSRLREALALAWLAHPVAHGSPALRGAGWQGRFEQAEVVVTLATHSGSLTGRVRRRAGVQAEAAALVPSQGEHGQAWLLARKIAEGEPLVSALDERGRFQFPALAPGEYDLLLNVAGRDIAVERITMV
jgi:anti-sigma factor RsiW